MANGKVITGYSNPIVARYTYSGGAISYSDKMPLARGVEVSIEIETGDPGWQYDGKQRRHYKRHHLFQPAGQ